MAAGWQRALVKRPDYIHLLDERLPPSELASSPLDGKRAVAGQAHGTTTGLVRWLVVGHDGGLVGPDVPVQR